MTLSFKKNTGVGLIGAEKPNTENQFLEWSWSHDELKIANNERVNRLTKVVLKDDSLYSLFIELKSEVEKIKEEFNLFF
mgnify:CR=1 FL=1